MTLSWSNIKKALCLCYFHSIRIFLPSSIIKHLQASITLPDLKFLIVHLATCKQIYLPIMYPSRPHHQRHRFFIRLIVNLLPFNAEVVLVAGINSKF